MHRTPKPRRSVLYMPGSNSRAMEKARELPADSLIFDLEDAVAPEAKDAARTRSAAIRAGGYGRREVVVRVNGIDTPWFEEDLRSRAPVALMPCCCPKSNPAKHRRSCPSTGSGRSAGRSAVWIMTETPRGVLDLDNISDDQPRVQVIVMGTSDLAKEMRLASAANRAGLMHALGHCVLTARAHGLDIIDGVHLALDDTDGFRSACQQGRDLGFDGKSLIHPRQIGSQMSALASLRLKPRTPGNC